MRYMPLGVPRPARRFDLSGFLLLSTSMLMLSLALDGLSELLFGYAAVSVIVIFGLASLSSYWMHAAGVTEPLFSIGLFK